MHLKIKGVVKLINNIKIQQTFSNTDDLLLAHGSHNKPPSD